jgi:hypothetical protein
MPTIEEDDDIRMTALSIQDQRDESIEQPLIEKDDEDKDKEEGEASSGVKKPLLFGFGQISKGSAEGSGTANPWGQLVHLSAE